MKLCAIILFAVVVQSSARANTNQPPIIPEQVNVLIAELEPGMSTEGALAVVRKYYPQAQIRDGDWSGHGGYYCFVLTERYRLEVAYSSSPYQTTKWISWSPIIYVYDELAKRRVGVQIYDWTKTNSTPATLTPEQWLTFPAENRRFQDQTDRVRQMQKDIGAKVKPETPKK